METLPLELHIVIVGLLVPFERLPLRLVSKFWNAQVLSFILDYEYSPEFRESYVMDDSEFVDPEEEFCTREGVEMKFFGPLSKNVLQSQQVMKQICMSNDILSLYFHLHYYETNQIDMPFTE